MKLYRFTESFQGSTVLEDFEVIKRTPAGYWIADWSNKNGKRWVSKTGFKRYAYADKEKAADSYIARKRRQINILKTRLDDAEHRLKSFVKNKGEMVNGEKTLLPAAPGYYDGPQDLLQTGE